MCESLEDRHPPRRMNSEQRPNHRDQGGDRKLRQQMEKKPKMKQFPAEAIFRRDLNMCSKDGDLLRALDIYNQSVAEGTVKWNQYNFNVLLYLCSAAASGTLLARKSGANRKDAECHSPESAEQNLNRGRNVETVEATTQEQQDMGSMGKHNGATAAVRDLNPDMMELATKRGFEIYEDMKRQQVAPNEATLTAVARLAEKRGDGDLAFQMIKEMAAMNIAPKLRSYSPALMAFCKTKEVIKAFEVDAHMVGAGVQPEEPELRALLQLCVELGLESEVYTLLHRLRVRVRETSPSTVAVIEEWFSGKAGASAGNGSEQPDIAAIRQAEIAGGGGWHGLGWLGKGEWKMERTCVDKKGVCCSCKEQLVTIDLDPQETDKFAQALSDLAFSRESKPNEFKRFQEWLGDHGPFDAIVDGANVGLYNQNFAQGGFNFYQLNTVVKAAEDQGLVKRSVLVILHHRRTKLGAASTSLARELLQKWASTNMLYTTPNGSNDDWYWLYAAVRNKCLLITNDEMRDHLFQLLGTDFFPKWKERHQVRFSATGRGPQLHLPPLYSLVIQESGKGAWHIPKSGGNDIDTPREWLCVTRSVASSENTPSADSTPKATFVENVKQAAATSHEMDICAENDQVILSHSTEADGTDGASSPKRLRLLSPSSTLHKMRLPDMTLPK